MKNEAAQPGPADVVVDEFAEILDGASAVDAHPDDLPAEWT